MPEALEAVPRQFATCRRCLQTEPSTTDQALPIEGRLERNVFVILLVVRFLPQMMGSQPLSVGELLMSSGELPRESVKGIEANTSCCTASGPDRDSPADGTSRESDGGTAEKRRDGSDVGTTPPRGRLSPYARREDLTLGGLLRPHWEIPSASGE